MEKIYLTWQDIEEAVDSLARNIVASGKQITSIYGLQRGGLVPAVMLSHKLNIPFHKPGDAGANVLIVDDICDSGETLAKFKHESNIYTATIHYKQTAIIQPTFHYEEVVGDVWIVYPWEREDSETIADYKK